MCSVCNLRVKYDIRGIHLLHPQRGRREPTKFRAIFQMVPNNFWKGRNNFSDSRDFHMSKNQFSFMSSVKLFIHFCSVLTFTPVDDTHLDAVRQFI